MKSRGARVWFAVPVLAACCLLGPGQCGAAPADPAPAGTTARAWEFTDLDGVRQTVDWNAREKRCVVVFFFDPQSPGSLLGLSYFDALFKRAGDFGLAVFGVEATGRQAEELRTLMRGYAAVYSPPSFPVTADPVFAAAKIFGSHRAPTALLLDDRGQRIALRSAFDLGTAVEITRMVERLLGRGEGFFSPALRDVGLSEPRERQLSAQAEATDRDDRAAAKVLAPGDRLPAFEFIDTAGRVDRWGWPSTAVSRLAFFWSGASPDAAADLAYLQGLLARVGGTRVEIIAVESTRLAAAELAGILKDVQRRGPAPAFPVVADPQGRLVGLFGAGDRLPQTFLVGRLGDVVYRADGFDAGVQGTLVERIERTARLSGPGLPQADNPDSGGSGADGDEAPSISRRMERDQALRFNLSQGDYYFSNGQHERAVLFYQRYLELEPSSLHALVRLAQIYDINRDPARAREYWERVLAISPNHAEGRARLEELRRIRDR